MSDSAGSGGSALQIARGVVGAVSPDGGLDRVQASLLRAVFDALMGVELDFGALEPVSPEELASTLAEHDEGFRRRIVHHMVLAELVLRPIPLDVATRVAIYAKALRIEDQFVRIARRYAQGAFGLAWMDLHRSGFAEHWEAARMDQLKSTAKLPDQLSPGIEDPELAARWRSFEAMDPGSLGRSVWEMYVGRGFALPGSPGGASAYLAQHDFVHVVADYGTNLFGELEVFSLIGRADPDPKGFAWIATLIGLFETGFVADAGFFTSDLKQRHLNSPGMHHRIADAMRRGQHLCDHVGTDLLELDYHDWVEQPVDELRRHLGLLAKSESALRAGSPGVFDLEGMSERQQTFAMARQADERKRDDT